MEVNGKTAYLVQGIWSAESINMLTSLDTEALATYTPSWDYDWYLSLSFEFELPQNETVGVVISATLSSAEWITPDEMIKIAESMQQVD